MHMCDLVLICCALVLLLNAIERPDFLHQAPPMESPGSTKCCSSASRTSDTVEANFPSFIIRPEPLDEERLGRRSIDATDNTSVAII